MTGRDFENECVQRLHTAGYWVHRIHPDETGQQPFDIIAVKGSQVCVYDAKVVSNGRIFRFERIEDNQYNAFNLAHQRMRTEQIGFLIYWRDSIRFLSFTMVKHFMLIEHKRSVSLESLPLWRIP